jgi:hypothetical protein
MVSPPLEYRMQEQIYMLELENKQLRAALKPFADWVEARDADHTTAGYPDSCPLAYHPEGANKGAATVGDLRRAGRLFRSYEFFGR